MFLNNNLKKIDMKNTYKLLYGVLALLIIVTYSCKKSDVGGTGAPTITRVRTVTKNDTVNNVVKRITLDSSTTQRVITIVSQDSTVTEGGLGNQYAIVGTNLLTTKSVSFNGVNVYFNPGLLTDHSIIITIPSLTSTAAQVPFGPGQTDKIIVVTKYGTVTYNFPIRQPAPVITSFLPQVANPGDTVTITGQVFNGVTAVAFDKIPATIVGTPTATTVQVRVPQGVSSNFIYVTTPGGTAVSTTNFGFKYVVYTEALTPGWGQNGGYDGYESTKTYNDKSHPESGTYDIACVFTNIYGELQLGYGGATPVNVSTLGLTALKFSVYAGAGYTAGQRVQIVINGNYVGSAEVLLTVKPGAYTDFIVPLSSLGSPTTIKEIVIQNYGVGEPCTIYVDNIGFI
jgi:hypothetical protein